MNPSMFDGYTRQNPSSDKETMHDRISDFHIAILSHILSYIPTLDAVHTCVLSKGWRNIWRSVPSLSFDQYLTKKDFLEFIDNVISSHDGSTIDKFHLSTLYSTDSLTNLIGKCIDFVVRRNVQFIDLKLPLCDSLPPSIFTCESLKHLKLFSTSNIFGPARRFQQPYWIYLPKLETLHLIRVGFYDVESLISSCPILENLILVTCMDSDLRNFMLSALCLKTLYLENVAFSDDQSIESLFSSCLLLEALILKNCSYSKVKKFTISAPRLKDLSFQHSNDKILEFPQEAAVITISAPALTSFQLFVYSLP
ncbi:hypothetical protein GIB67_026298 [Kingdonia uniflora]|uniref:Uncharacterized protein n=1 Tax=Kingdonia uniflora TaxID=39325 RepID=A0A7J7N613_9MAGN|nr:hypothetical protein GIB67_026298 [Kingdonia uniflora]